MRDNYPHAHIALLLRPYVRDVVEHAPWFDEIIELGPGAETLGAPAYARLVQRVRAGRFDLALLLPNSFRCALQAALAGVRHRVGYVRDARRWLLTHATPRPSANGRFEPTYMGDFYLRLCQRAGCAIGDRSPQLFTSPEDDAAARRKLRGLGVSPRRPLFLICPGASFGSSKHWPTDRFARLADLLVERFDASIVITGGASEAAMAGDILSLMAAPAISLAGEARGLRLLKSLVKMADLMVTVDSGSRHFAVAQGKPAVVLMGPTHPGYTSTELEIGEVVRVDVDCGPCQRKRCPTDHRCMSEITPGAVLAACERVLAGASG